MTYVEERAAEMKEFVRWRERRRADIRRLHKQQELTSNPEGVGDAGRLPNPTGASR